MMETEFDDIEDLEEEGESLEAAFPSRAEQARDRKKLAPLPPSSDKKFWGEDAELHLTEKVNPTVPSGCNYVQHGPWEICISCPNQHTRVPKFINQ